MEEDDQRAVLRAMEPDDRAAIEEALSYPEESAGRLMQRELIAVPEHWTVGDVDRLSARQRGTDDRFLGDLRRRSRAQAGRHLPAVVDPAHAARRSRSPT